MGKDLNVLVAYASEHGSTEGVAEFIADRLTAGGLRAQARRAETALDLTDYHAVVIGSAVHNMAWMPEAVDFVQAHLTPLAERSVWLFSVGSRDSLSGPVGRWMAARYKDPREIPGFSVSIHHRDHRIFSGVVTREHYPFVGRLLIKAIGGRYGDFRDWTAIGAWADGITHTLLSGLRAPKSPKAQGERSR